MLFILKHPSQQVVFTDVLNLKLRMRGGRFLEYLNGRLLFSLLSVYATAEPSDVFTVVLYKEHHPHTNILMHCTRSACCTRTIIQTLISVTLLSVRW